MLKARTPAIPQRVKLAQLDAGVPAKCYVNNRLCNGVQETRNTACHALRIKNEQFSLWCVFIAAASLHAAEHLSFSFLLSRRIVPPGRLPPHSKKAKVIVWIKETRRATGEVFVRERRANTATFCLHASQVSRLVIEFFGWWKIGSLTQIGLWFQWDARGNCEKPREQIT
jgi:hypothetical protein